MRVSAKKRDKIARGNPSGYVKVPYYAMWPEMGHVKLPFYAMWYRRDKRVDVVVRLPHCPRKTSTILTVPANSIEYGEEARRWITKNMPKANAL